MASLGDNTTEEVISNTTLYYSKVDYASSMTGVCEERPGTQRHEQRQYHVESGFTLEPAEAAQPCSFQRDNVLLFLRLLRA